jgi:hypothetical protein
MCDTSPLEGGGAGQASLVKVSQGGNPDKRDDRFGSISTKLGYPGDDRFPPVSDQTADIAGGPVRANRRHGNFGFA